MSDNILNVKKHTCPTCGGQLKVDLSRQMYECPFCGVTFDYAYFNEEDVLSRATRSLLAGEFHSAGEAYDFMLTKEPHNFSALRGKVLASAMAKSLSDLDQVEKLSKMDNNAVSASVQRALSDCDPKHTPYFSKMKELFEVGKEYKAEQDQAHSLRRTKKQHLSKVRSLEVQKEETLVKVRDPDDRYGTTNVDPKPILIFSLVIYVLWVVLVLALFLWVPNAPGVAKSTTRKTYTVSTVRSTSKVKTKTSTKLEVPGQDADLSGIDTEVVESMWIQAMSPEETEQDEARARLEKELEELERKKEEKEKEKREDLRSTVTVVLVLSTLVEGLIVFYLGRKMKKEKEFNDSISAVLETTDGLSEQIAGHVEKAAQLKRKVHQIYREMKDLDPEPDSELYGISSNGMRKRWM